MAPKVPYFNQQHGTPPAGATKRHPLAVTKIATPNGPKPTGPAYLDQQAQQLHDKGRPVGGGVGTSPENSTASHPRHYPREEPLTR